MSPLRWTLACVASLSLLAALPARAVDVRFEKVVEGVYAFIGETGPRTESNEGLNANLGLVLTAEGAVLIDSGATFQGARQVHEAIRRVTPLPVRWVINTGGQDHRWLGNGYFLAQGAEVLAHAAGQADMANRGGEQLAALKQVMGPKADGTVPTFPSRWLQGPDASLALGGVRFEFKHRGGAHTPGEMLVWLPQQRVLFSGDVVYVDRMLGVLPVSNTRAWLDTFDEIERLAPERIVPGHGRVSDLARARADTRDYLAALRAHMKRAVDEGQDIGTAIKGFDTQPYQRLANSAELLPGNASRVYLEMERE
ncbi:MBL fold metallo-hydrolase [Hydrogenophaga sp.]|uniref:MBL fold metallo-hydrolase n=1 Tax=Hydrogenophaga sp. TaxID=1904254 RepID=UPI00391A544D